MIDLDMIDLVDAPGSKRVKVVTLTPVGEAMRTDARAAMGMMVTELVSRLGRTRLQRTAAALGADWGPPLTFEAASTRRTGKHNNARRSSRARPRVS
jgi:hypothetical protein